MKRIEVKLSVDVVAPLLDVVRAVADDLRAQPSPAMQLGDMDPELAAAWRADLVAGQQADLELMLGMFKEEFFRDGTITLDGSNAEAVLRASAAVRLRLRSAHLEGIEEEELESGAVELEELPEPVRRPFVCYLFLATLQELIIQHLDPATPES